MLDIQAVEDELAKIQGKISAFLANHSANIDQYYERLKSISETRQIFFDYLAQIKEFYQEINGLYPAYLRKKL